MIERSYSDQTSAQTEALDYCLTDFRRKTPEEKFPLLYVFHGTGVNGCDELDAWQNEADNRRMMVLAANRERIYPNRPEALKIFLDLLKETVNRYPVDPGKIYLIGSSSGGLIVQQLLLDMPSEWNKAVFIGAAVSAVKFEHVKADGFPPVLFIHGRNDKQIKWEEVEKSAAQLKSKGVAVRFFLDSRAGHEQGDSWKTDIINWLQSGKLEN